MTYSTICLFPNLAQKGNTSEGQNGSALLCAMHGEKSLTRITFHVAKIIISTLDGCASEGLSQGL